MNYSRQSIMQVLWMPQVVVHNHYSPRLLDSLVTIPVRTTDYGLRTTPLVNGHFSLPVSQFTYCMGFPG